MIRATVTAARARAAEASEQLNRRLVDLTRRGQRPPCAADDRWLAEDQDERRRSCEPVRRLPGHHRMPRRRSCTTRAVRRLGLPGPNPAEETPTRAARAVRLTLCVTTGAVCQRADFVAATTEAVLTSFQLRVMLCGTTIRRVVCSEQQCSSSCKRRKLAEHQCIHRQRTYQHVEDPGLPYRREVFLAIRPVNNEAKC